MRVTPAQYSLLQQSLSIGAGQPPRDGARKPHVKKPKNLLPENQLVAQIKGYLECRGWICTRQHVGTFYRRMSNIVAISIPKGPADWRAERPIIPPGAVATMATCFPVEMFYFETKAPGNTPEPHQRLWLEQRQLTGITADWFDSLEMFIAWYRKRYGRCAGDAPLAGVK